MLSNTFKRILTISRPSVTRQVDSNDAMGKREKALEDIAIREQEKKLIEKLREEIKQKDQRIKNQDAKLATSETATEGAQESGGDVDSKIRLLRKEVMGKIRDLEDEIQEIKYRLRI